MTDIFLPVAAAAALLLVLLAPEPKPPEPRTNQFPTTTPIAERFQMFDLARANVQLTDQRTALEKSVLVPRGLAESGEAFSRPWSTTVTGTRVIDAFRTYAISSGRPFVTRHRSYTYWKTGADLGFLGHEPDQGFHPLTTGPQAPRDDWPPELFGGAELAVAVAHGADYGLDVFPRAVYERDELEAWMHHYDVWLWGGPLSHRAVQTRAQLISQGGRAMDAAIPFYPIRDETFPHHVIAASTALLPGTGTERYFAKPSLDYLWDRYLRLCIACAGWGLLPSPAQPFTVPKVGLTTSSSNVFGDIWSGVKQTVYENGGLVISAALGNVGAFLAQAALKTVATFAALASGAVSTEGKVPWHPAWEPVLVPRNLIGSKFAPQKGDWPDEWMTGPLKYHTFGKSWADTEGADA